VTTKKSLPLNDEELEAYEASRDLYAELKQSAEDLQNGLGRVVYSPLIAARKKTGLTQQQFAELLCISVEKLDNWEQQREQPTKAVCSLVALLLDNPKAVDDMLTQ
jgi:putative transcriptional regulator